MILAFLICGLVVVLTWIAFAVTGDVITLLVAVAVTVVFFLGLAAVFHREG